MSGLTWLARKRVLVDENGTESGGVDAQIPVTKRETHQVTKFVSRLDPLPSFWTVFSGCGSGRLLVAVALGLGLVAFGSVSVAPRSCPLYRSVSVGSNSKKKRAPTPEPAVIQRSLFGMLPSCFDVLGLRFLASEATRRRDTWWCTS